MKMGEVLLFDYQVELIVKLLRESDYYNCSSIERYDHQFLVDIIIGQFEIAGFNVVEKTADPEADRGK